jgi:hypothetical protein
MTIVRIPVLVIACVAGLSVELAGVIAIQASSRIPGADGFAEELPARVTSAPAGFRVDLAVAIAVQA